MPLSPWSRQADRREPQTANGHGYISGQSVQVRWGTPAGPILGTAPVTSLGTWTLNFTVPVNPAGSYQVIGLGQPSGPTAQKAFKITQTPEDHTSERSARLHGDHELHGATPPVRL